MPLGTTETEAGLKATIPPPAARFSIHEAEAELAVIENQEREIELELDRLYRRTAHLVQSECRSLAECSEQHKQVPAAIRRLQETLGSTSTIADELSSRVRKLDVVSSRVSEALKLVDDMLDLRECSEHVNHSITSGDYEQAAKFIARFRSVEGALPSGTDDAVVKVLRDAEKKLGSLVQTMFEEAMAKRDRSGVSRFAKLFHPLGMEGEGVKKYIRFIQQTLAEQCAANYKALAPSAGRRADQEPMPYAEGLTKVFVAIADIVQEHQQDVEKEFGPENFILVLRGMLEEADTQGLKIVQKFTSDHAKIFEHHDAKFELREAGVALEEIALITQRAQQFDTYIHGVAAGVMSVCEDKSFLANLGEDYDKKDGLVPLTKLMRRVQELVSSYVVVEQAFLLQSMALAIHETDSLDASDPEQLTTTMVDDVFYILQASMMRASTTCDVNAVCALVNHVSAALGSELKDGLQGHFQESKRLYGPFVSHFKNIEPPAKGEHPLMPMFYDMEGRMRSPLTCAYSWPHCLNNLNQCCDYLEKLKASAEEAFDEYFPDIPENKDKRTMFQHCLVGLDGTKSEFQSMHTAHCKIGLQLLKVHLSPMLVPLDSLDYDISEAQYADYQVNDPFVKNFIATSEAIYRHLNLVLNKNSAEEILQHMVDQSCRRVENVILGGTKRFSLFGALQFDTDVRALCSFFTNLSERALRHKFARLFEMSSLLNLESLAELQEFYGEMKTWRLQSDEIRKVLSLRVDFNLAEAERDMLLPF